MSAGKKNLQLTTYPPSPRLRRASNLRPQAGFTIIELLVVIFMMSIIATLFVANYAGTRGPRNLRIAQNQLISNLRKVQSYTLSARNSPNGLPARFYVVKFSTLSPESYTIQVIDNSTPSSIIDTETVSLPQGITLAVSSPLLVEQPIGQTPSSSSCVQVGFLLPFSRTYMSKTCGLGSVADSPAELDVLKNSLLTVALVDSASNTTRRVQVNAVTGAITPQ